MVCVNYRINYGIENTLIIDFFKKIGYRHRRTNKNAISVEHDVFPSEEFIRNKNSGRYHLFIIFGKKYSGTEAYPQVKALLHYDIVKNVKGIERHFPDSHEKRNMREIYRIEKQMIKLNIGFLEEKDKNCAHKTIRNNHKKKLIAQIQEKYDKYDTGKYRRSLKASQYVISIIEQAPYIHLICVYAKIIGKNHNLNKKRAEKELQRLLIK